jgi:hypothetical protein
LRRPVTQEDEMKSLALLALLLAPPALADQPAAAEHRGAAFTMQKSMSLDEVAKTPDAYAGKPVQVAGTVSAVCKAKGCWMTLKGDQATARITFKDYAFFVPTDCEGRKATVEGTLEVKKLSPEERKHFADDAKVDVSKIPESELRLVASGVELGAK